MPDEAPKTETFKYDRRWLSITKASEIPDLEKVNPRDEGVIVLAWKCVGQHLAPSKKDEQVDLVSIVEVTEASNLQVIDRYTAPATLFDPPESNGDPVPPTVGLTPEEVAEVAELDGAEH